MVSVTENRKKELEKKRRSYSRHYLLVMGENIEEDPYFIRWLGKLDCRGNRMFLLKCDRCDGEGKKDDFGVKRIKGKLRTINIKTYCGKCRGTGRVRGPFYCKDCSGLLPHPNFSSCRHVP